MKIAVPRERKTLEKRVALTPHGAKELCQRGHEVYIETGAGAGSFYRDEDYQQAGCKIAADLKTVWNNCDLLVKVKEPHESEFPLFRPGLKVFTYLHLAGLPLVAKALVEKHVTGIAYELVEAADGSLPLLAPMSQVAGKLAVQNAAHYLLTQNGGRGVLLGGTEKVPPGKVIILGAGIAGFAAAQVASGMGAEVLVFDLNPSKLEALSKKLPGVKTSISTAESLSAELTNTDILISAVLIPGAKAPRVLTKAQLDLLPRGAVVLDISIDQGGSIEGIKNTSLAEPTYNENGIIFYAVPNMPSQAARTSTEALTAETLPLIIKMADEGFDLAFENSPGLRKAICTDKGQICNPAVAEALSS